MKKVLIVFVLIIGMIAAGAGVMWMTLTNNMKEIRSIPIEEMDLSQINDQLVRGTYYYEDQIGATVDVEIENGEIVEITYIEHIAGKGTIAEVIRDDIIREQSLLVDDISGATTSSHVIKLAIQNALEEAK